MPPVKKSKSQTDTPADNHLPTPPEGDDTSVQDQDVAGPELVEFEFRGVTFRIPKDRDEWPTTSIIALSKGQFAEGVQEALGPAQWKALSAILPKYGDFMRLFIPVFAEAQKDCVGG